MINISSPDSRGGLPGWCRRHVEIPCSLLSQHLSSPNEAQIIQQSRVHGQVRLACEEFELTMLGKILYLENSGDFS